MVFYQWKQSATRSGIPAVSGGGVKFNRLITFFIPFGILLSCSSSEFSERDNSSEKNCETIYHSLIFADDSTPVFNFQWDENSDSVYDKLCKMFVEVDECEEMTYALEFGREKIAISSIKPCNIIDISINSAIDILVNEQNQILAGNEWVTADSVFFQIMNTYSKFNLNKCVIRIKWDKNSSPGIIMKVIQESLKAKCRIYEMKTLDIFKKDICELAIKEVEKLKKEVRVMIQLGITSEPPKAPKIIL